MTNRLLAALLVFLSGCQMNPPDKTLKQEYSPCEKTLKPSDLLSLGKICDGKQVIVRGFLRDGFDKHGIWDSIEDIEGANFRKACVTISNPHRENIFGAIRLVDLTGIFRAEWPEGLVLMGGCSESLVEVKRVKSIEKGG